MARSQATRVAVDVTIELAIVFLLWCLFVSKIERAEFFAGIAAAVIATFADQVVKNKDVINFRPKLRQLLWIFTEPYYAITGTWAIFKALARKLLGKPSEAQFRAVTLDTGGDDPQSQAQRVLMIEYMTMTPTFIVVGIDCERHEMLLHEISPTPTPLIAKALGALE